MFLVLAGLFLIITWGMATFSIWQSFITKNGIILFLQNLKAEILHQEPLLPGLSSKSQPSLKLFFKHLTIRPLYLFTIVSFLVISGSFSLYFKAGSYNFPNQPLIKRLEAKKSHKTQYLVIAEMLLERLQKYSENGKDWKWLGQVLFMAEDYEGSVKAFRQAIQKGEDTDEVYADLGEALIMEQDGQIMAEAIRAFMSSLRKNRHNLKASYFLAVSRWQKNDDKSAVAIFKQILNNTSKQDPWHLSAQEHIKEIVSLTGLNVHKIEPLDLSITARGFEP